MGIGIELDPQMPLTGEAPEEDGIYDGVPDVEYHKWDLASNSRLTTLRNKSPMHCVHRILNDEKTDALSFGTLVHDRILLPERFPEKYVKEPALPLGKTRRAKEYQDALREIQAEHPDREVVKQEDWDKMEQIEANLFRHPVASQLIVSATAYERSFVFTEDLTGQRVKCRVDIDNEEFDAMCDLKSTSAGVDTDSFSVSINKWGYHRQGALYLGGGRKVGMKRKAFLFIAFESAAPFDVHVMRLREDALDVAISQLVPALKKYKSCREAGVWPGVGDMISDVSIPHWAIKYEEG